MCRSRSVPYSWNLYVFFVALRKSNFASNDSPNIFHPSSLTAMAMIKKGLGEK
jgi:hypothetical protein